MKKKIIETPTEKYLREILEQIKIQNSRPIMPPYNVPQQYFTGTLPPMTWCQYCRVYNCGQMHVT